MSIVLDQTTVYKGHLTLCRSGEETARGNSDKSSEDLRQADFHGLLKQVRPILLALTLLINYIPLKCKQL